MKVFPLLFLFTIASSFHVGLTKSDDAVNKDVALLLTKPEDAEREREL